MKKFSFVSLYILLISTGIFAQQKNTELPVSFYIVLDSNINVMNLPDVDIKKLLEEDKYNDDKGMPFRNGIVHTENLDFKETAKINYLCDAGYLYRLCVKANQSKYLSFSFNGLIIPDGAKLFIYSKDKSFVSGPFTRENISENGTFYSQQIPGTEVIVEYYEPSNTNTINNFKLQTITNLYK